MVEVDGVCEGTYWMLALRARGGLWMSGMGGKGPHNFNRFPVNSLRRILLQKFDLIYAYIYYTNQNNYIFSFIPIAIMK